MTALNANSALHTRTRYAVLELSALTDTLVGELVETRIDPHTRFITGGFGHAQQGDVFSWLLYYWSGTTFRQRAETLHAACATMGLNSTLDSAAQAVLATPTLMHLVDQSLDALNAKDRDTLSNEMRGLLLQRELRRCLDTLAEVALRPLVTWLRRQGATSLTLIPCGWLALFPLAAVTLADGSTVGETLPTSVAPSARSLLRNEPVAVQRSGVLTIGDPHPTQQALFWAKRRHMQVKFARHLAQQGEVRVQYQATRNSFIQMLAKRYIVAASCHGVFDSDDFLRSALLLAKGTRLTLGDMLNHEANLPGLRLLILRRVRHRYWICAGR